MSDSATHVYCEACEKIQPAERQPLDMVDTTGQFVGGDILCGVCTSFVATVYREMTEAEHQAHASAEDDGHGKT